MRLSSRTTLSLLTLSLLAVSVASLALGSAQIENVWSYIFNPLLNPASSAHQIIWDIRAPRVAAALIVGVMLAIAGVLAQGGANNPLADPAIIGTTAGASLGVLLGVFFNIVSIGSVGSVVFATIGALGATLLVFSLARSSMQLVIIGIGVSAILSAVVGLAISIVDRADARSVSFWAFGSLSLVTLDSLWMLLPIAVLGAIAAWRIAPSLDLLSLGDTSASHLGFAPQKIRAKAFLILALLVAAAVTTVGTISFLALAAPHIARSFVGPRARKLIPVAALNGALILLIADTAARSIAPPLELPIGLITSLIGAPILILAVKKSAQVWR